MNLTERTFLLLKPGAERNQAPVRLDWRCFSDLLENGRYQARREPSLRDTVLAGLVSKLIP